MIDVITALEARGIDPYPSGDGFVMALCPFHDDNNPSFSVNARTGSYRCFGCHEHGSFAELIAALDEIPLKDAIRLVKSQARPDDMVRAIEHELDNQETDIQFFSEAAFHNVFGEVWDTPGYEYLQGRGLDDETIERFDCRWGDHAKYVDRVVIPIRMPDGNVLSYVGRSVHPDAHPKTRKARAFKRTLFGVYELLRDFGCAKHIVLVEGEFDAMWLQQHNVPAVSVMGTSELSDYQRGILKSLKVKIVLSYDADKAGIVAVYGGHKRRGELELLKRWMSVSVITLPEGSDPNDLTSKQVEKIYGRFVN